MEVQPAPTTPFPSEDQDGDVRRTQAAVLASQLLNSSSS